MGYKGTISPIPMGNGGLHTDDPQNKVAPTDLIRAINCQFYNGLLEKEAGSQRFNSFQLPSGVVGTHDWWPNEVSQRLIATCRDGKVYRFRSGKLNFHEMVPSDSSPSSLIANEGMVSVAGGAELTGHNRKLFLFTGSIPQVIDGDSTTRRAMTKPALDWTGSNQPTFGIVHRSALFAFGNKNNPHTVYKSSSTDHEDFQSASAQFYPCDSGHGEKLVCGIVYKGALFVVKYPRGLYQLVDSDADQANWYFKQIQNELGGGSTHSIAAIINDALIANANGAISSASATLDFGNLRTGELMYILRNENFMREQTNQLGFSKRHSIYYSDKKLYMASYQSAGGIKNDMVVFFDLNNQSQPKVSWSQNKDQPNCLALRKDSRGVERPMYGSDDGYIYLMDQVDRDVGGNAYTFDCQTPHMDFGWMGPSIADQNKIFDFLELDYVPTGDFTLKVEVYGDGKYIKTLEFNLSGPSNLDTFMLDQNRLSPESVPQNLKTLKVTARRLSLRMLNANVGENVKIAGFNVYFQLSDMQNSSRGKQ